MSYKQWFDAHAAKHAAIMEKLTRLSDDEVIEYFRFENMVKNEPDFCPLYAENKKCHDTEELNCYLCACPNFRFSDAGFAVEERKILFSTCSIESPDGDRYVSESAIHQNCAGCIVPHRESYIKKVFDRDWLKIMKEVPSE
ncbi:hypothetical protein Sulku_0022 [Sulfuricurvum kujiense DSM 16994]|uniref:Cysteine-rich small domain-containing protein n=1 Tax=Sulfuricurvum kujiense (strain ATCC BAA-921 / DSM 16994 / JCM 11577 / YK-1) TaxID=709032 RepID=E4TW74_SULKY|nr:hypothetical protein [Sulfuricurvum kujiense]ADR32690.1 hypothetical protein Sulku_0022 [Sulfuricurvum kujiense DSM 16994]